VRSYALILMEIYSTQKGKNIEDRIQKTKNHLQEITTWSIKKPFVTSKFTIYSPDIQINNPEERWGVYLEERNDMGDNVWEIKFGYYNKPDPEDKFFWKDNDPERFQKSHFIQNVLKTEISPLLKVNNSKIIFDPYDGDGRGDDRLSYFTNMFIKTFNPQEYEMRKEDEYWLIKKINPK
jgi:hypothetical protein